MFEYLHIAIWNCTSLYFCRLSVCPLSVRPSFCHSVRPSVRQFVSPSVRQDVSPSVRQGVRISNHFLNCPGGTGLFIKLLKMFCCAVDMILISICAYALLFLNLIEEEWKKHFKYFVENSLWQLSKKVSNLWYNFYVLKEENVYTHDLEKN